MNFLTTLLHKLVSGLASVDAIVADMHRGIERLERASAAHEKQAEKLDLKIRGLAEMSADSLDQSARAKRVARKLRDLVN